MNEFLSLTMAGMEIEAGLPPTWKTWKSQGITNLFKMSGKSQGT